MHHKEMSVVHGEQKWKCGIGELKRDIRIDADTLNIQGQSMDAVYNGLLSQISGLSASTKEEYKEIKIDNLKLPGLDEEKPIDIDGKDYLK